MMEKMDIILSLSKDLESFLENQIKPNYKIVLVAGIINIVLSFSLSGGTFHLTYLLTKLVGDNKLEMQMKESKNQLDRISNEREDILLKYRSDIALLGIKNKEIGEMKKLLFSTLRFGPVSEDRFQDNVERLPLALDELSNDSRIKAKISEDPTFRRNLQQKFNNLIKLKDKEQTENALNDIRKLLQIDK